MVLRRVIAIFGALCLTLMGLAPSIASAASSSPYFNQVAQALKRSPVYVDPSASPTITATQASNLASQIQRTQHPIYLVLMSNSQVGSISPENLPAAVHDALGGSEVIGVSSSKGFYANGFGLPASIANAAGPAAKQAVDLSSANHTRPAVPNDVFTNWVSAMGSLQVPAPAPTSVRGNATGSSRATTPTAPAKHDDGPPVGTILLVGLILVLLAIAAIVVVMVLRRRQKIQRLGVDIDQVRTEIVNSSSRYPGANFDSAFTNLRSAETALGNGDIGGTEHFLDQARRHREEIVRDANRSTSSDLHVDPPRGYASSSGGSSTQATATATTPPAQQARSDSVARVQRPDGSTIVINNHTYMPQQSQMPGYGHYYGGGWYGGWYYGPGWYADPFWTYNLLAMDLALTELSVADRLNYDAGFRAGEIAAEQTTVATGTSGGDAWNSGTPSGDPVVTGDAGGDAWNNAGSGDNNSSGDSGGGDAWNGGSSSSDSGDSGSSWNDSGSSSDSGSSFGGDSSGGFDSGGGFGGDSGGGFDSGGGDSGGDW